MRVPDTGHTHYFISGLADTRTMSRLVSVVVPCHNEEANIQPLCEKIAAVFEFLPQYAYECLLVDDASTDGTREAMAQAAKANPCIHPVHLLENAGQSAALLTGMRLSHGEMVLTIDGDLQNDPNDFPRMLELLEEYDCVCGYRVQRDDQWHRVAISKVANRILRLLFDTGVRDAGCGIKGFRRECLRHFAPFNGMHRFFAVFVRKAGLRLVEYPVTHHARRHGVSKYGINNRLWRTLYDFIGVSWLCRRHIAPRVEGED